MTTIALAASLAACGGGGEEDTSTPTSAAQAGQAQTEESAEVRRHDVKAQGEDEEGQQAEAPTSEEQEVEETATDFYAILGADEVGKNPDKTTIDSTSFCELMSEEAQAQTIHYAEVSSGLDQEWDCESAVELLVLRAKRAGGLEAIQKVKVVGINAQGDKATATVRFGEGGLTSIPLVREDGEWKLAASSIGAGQ